MLTVTVEHDATTQAISRWFDYCFEGTSTFAPPALPELPSQYQIGLIVGPSGSGKTTLLREMGGVDDCHEWDRQRAIVSHFATPEEGAERLSAAGLNSIPTWMRPYHVLSTGERFRADLARAVRSGARIDEFTSVVDRAVAQSAAVAISRYIRNNQIRDVVFASCHYDIIDWLSPDWVFDLATGQMQERRSLQRPAITVDIYRDDASKWPLFRQHHYLSASLNKAAHCYTAWWGNRLVGFAAVLRQPSGTVPNAWRESRIVILPDFQGMGIGVRLSDAMGALYTSAPYNGRYFSRTAHPRMGMYRELSPLWKGTSKNRRIRHDAVGYRLYNAWAVDTLRECYSHEYIGGSPDGHDHPRTLAVEPAAH